MLNSPHVDDPLFDSGVLRMAELRALGCVATNFCNRVREIYSADKVVVSSVDCTHGNAKFFEHLHFRRLLYKQPVHLEVTGAGDGHEDCLAHCDMTMYWDDINGITPISLKEMSDPTVAFFLAHVVYQFGRRRKLVMCNDVAPTWDDIEHGRFRIINGCGKTKPLAQALLPAHWVFIENVCAQVAEVRVAKMSLDSVVLKHMYLPANAVQRMAALLFSRRIPLRTLNANYSRVCRRNPGICTILCNPPPNVLVSLQELQIAHNPLDESEVHTLSQAFLKGHFPSLSLLNLRETTLMRHDMARLAPALSALSKTLLSLDLSDNWFGDAGMQSFIEHARLEKLLSLCFGRVTPSINGTSSRGYMRLARHLRAAEALPNLQYCYIPDDISPKVQHMVRHALAAVSQLRSYDLCERAALEMFPDAYVQPAPRRAR